MKIDRKRRLFDKVNGFDKLDTVFFEIIKEIKKVFDQKKIPILERKEKDHFYVFGQTISFSWKFIIDENLHYGEMIVSHLKKDDPEKVLKPFFTRYFDPRGNIHSKPGQTPFKHFIHDPEQMKELLYMILEDFLKLDCFKAEPVAEGLAEDE